MFIVFCVDYPIYSFLSRKMSKTNFYTFTMETILSQLNAPETHPKHSSKLNEVWPLKMSQFITNRNYFTKYFIMVMYEMQSRYNIHLLVFRKSCHNDVLILRLFLIVRPSRVVATIRTTMFRPQM